MGRKYSQFYAQFLSPCFFKKAKGILQSPPSVCLLCYLLNHWMKFNQIWCVSYSHEWACNSKFFFGTAPWGGIKRSNIIQFQLQSQFQRFLYQTLCVFSQMKDTKHIRRDFHSVAWVMPKGSDLGALGCPGGQKKISNMVMWHIK